MREQKTKEYLTAIFLLSTCGPVRGAYVAREMKLSRPTVSVALQSLAEDGYLTVDEGHVVHLTEAGEQMAREAMHETVRRGKSYRELVGQFTEENTAEPEGGCRRLTPEQALHWLKKQQADRITEAVLILSGRYYCVRVIDIAQFLERSSASVRSRLRQLEQGGYALLGEEGVVRLTALGEKIAKTQYEIHAAERERMVLAGQTPEEAERSVLLQ